jgi:hypothetical protein
MDMRRLGSLTSADSNMCAAVAGGSGCAWREFDDEVGVEGCADPFQ